MQRLKWFIILLFSVAAISTLNLLAHEGHGDVAGAPHGHEMTQAQAELYSALRDHVVKPTIYYRTLAEKYPNEIKSELLSIISDASESGDRDRMRSLLVSRSVFVVSELYGENPGDFNVLSDLIVQIDKTREPTDAGELFNKSEYVISRMISGLGNNESPEAVDNILKLLNSGYLNESEKLNCYVVLIGRSQQNDEQKDEIESILKYYKDNEKDSNVKNKLQEYLKDFGVFDRVERSRDGWSPTSQVFSLKNSPVKDSTPTKEAAPEILDSEKSDSSRLMINVLIYVGSLLAVFIGLVFLKKRKS